MYIFKKKSKDEKTHTQTRKCIENLTLSLVQTVTV